jgi:PAS domain S-box-containing protein
MVAVRLLIVEDERITAEDLRDILTELGYLVVSIVSSGTAAITEVERAAPDLVLMDIRIEGELDGTETAQILRERFDTPVIFLTAHSEEHTLARAKLAEPLGYVVKPFQEAELRATIEMALHKSRADRERKLQHHRLAAAVDSIGEGVICADAAGVVTYMNPSSEVWTGWARADALGKRLDEVVILAKRNGQGPVEIGDSRVLVDGLLAGLDPDVMLIARNGSEQSLGGTVAPIRDHTGRIVGLVFVFVQVQSDSELERTITGEP